MNPAPPPLPGQQRSLVRALCGPLLLTTLGILLAADHLGRLSFGRTWPVLLIVFGLCKLAEFAGGKQA
jgi:hypothetical protein